MFINDLFPAEQSYKDGQQAIYNQHGNQTCITSFHFYYKQYSDILLLYRLLGEDISLLIWRWMSAPLFFEIRKDNTSDSYLYG